MSTFRRGTGTRSSSGRATPEAQLRSILATPSTGIVNSRLVRAHGGADGINASTPTRASTGSTHPHPPARAAVRTCSSRTARPRRSCSALTRTTGARRNLHSAPSSSATWRRTPSSSTSAWIASDRGRPLRRSGTDAERRRATFMCRFEPSTSTFYLFAHNDTEDLFDYVEQALSTRSPLRPRLQGDSLRSRGRVRSRRPGLIPSMILGALPQRNAIKQDLRRPRPSLPRRASGLSA